MTLSIYRTAWGLVGESAPYPDLETFIRDSAARGYAGVEFPIFYIDPFEARVENVAAVLSETGLDYVPLLASRPAEWSSPGAHLADYATQLGWAQRIGATRAAVHFGADFFSFSDSCEVLAEAMTLASDHGIAPCFETHRGRILFNPFVTRDLLQAIPDMRLTSDLSHWMVVVDRWPDDIMDLFELASERSDHLHARVGYEKGPQIPEPADPVWQAHVDLHRGWWTKTVETARAEGRSLVLVPEFGPPPYMHAVPFTQAPVTDLISANEWMREKLAEWFF